MSQVLCDVVHSDDLGEVVGHFHGVPVISYDPNDAEERDSRAVRMRVLTKTGDGPGAVLEPGEVICSDNLIRTESAARRMTQANDIVAGSKSKKELFFEEIKRKKDGFLEKWQVTALVDGVCVFRQQFELSEEAGAIAVYNRIAASLFSTEVTSYKQMQAHA